MNGNNLLLDTNIILYFLNGDQTLIPLLEEKKLYVSFITQLETLAYKGITSEEQAKVNQFLSECIIIDINPVIKNYAIELRRQYDLKLPDSIIIATSLYLNIPVLTADKEFKKAEEIDLIFYEK